MIKKFLLALALVLVVHPAFAAVTATPALPQTPNRGLQNFVQGTDSAGTYKTIYTAGSNGSIVKGLMEANNDASATHLITCEIYNGTTGYPLIAVATGNGDGTTTGTPPKNIMAAANWAGLPVDSEGNPFFFIASGDTLKCTFATALTSSDSIYMIAVAADF